MRDNGLKDLIEDLRDYGNARRGEIAGLTLEAANRLDAFYQAIKQMRVELDVMHTWYKQLMSEGIYAAQIKGYINGLIFAERLMLGEKPLSALEVEEQVEEIRRKVDEEIWHKVEEDRKKCGF